MITVKEIQAKSIITASKLPKIDYVVNPYVGCQFACSYCYASFMGRFANETIANWGNYLHVKTNIIELFENEYPKLKFKNGRYPSLFISSVTDAYQPNEKVYRLTRGILEILVKNQYLGKISILTKSPLVRRDIDLFKQLPQVEVGMTVTAVDDHITRYVEMSAPSGLSRVKTLRHLAEEGIETYAFIGPLLPHYRYALADLEKLVASLAEAKVKSVYVEHINLSDYILKRMGPVLKQSSTEIQQMYRQAKFAKHREALDEMIYPLLEWYGIRMRGERTLYHQEMGRKD